LSPNIDTPVTASQNYYVPIYTERYNQEVLRFIDTTFTELTGQLTDEELEEDLD
jgi:hypothetical protein